MPCGIRFFSRLSMNDKNNKVFLNLTKINGYEVKGREVKINKKIRCDYE
jgi:hypothetical protein